MSMNSDIKSEWTKRLRDGRTQGKAFLEKDGAQCCLGVLCEIAAEQGVVDRYEYDDSEVEYGGLSSVPPREVLEWAGIETGSNLVGIEHRIVDGLGVRSLAEANDYGLSFDEIATIIEDEL